MIYVTTSNEKGSGRNAVEMTELMENAESPKGKLPAFPTAPWKSRQPREISTFPQLRRRLAPIEPKTKPTCRSLTYCRQKMVLTLGATLSVTGGQRFKQRLKGRTMRVFGGVARLQGSLNFSAVGVNRASCHESLLMGGCVREDSYHK